MTDLSQTAAAQLNAAAESIRLRAHDRKVWDMSADVAAIWNDKSAPSYDRAEKAVLAGWSPERAARELG